MVEFGRFPPGERAQAEMAQIPGIRFTEGATLGFEGPEGHLGPESAGCVMVLHATLADAERAQHFWERAAETCKAAREAPGLIRFVAFDDGLSSYAVAWWTTEESARAFAASKAHRDAVVEQVRNGYEYSQFAGLWGPMTVGHRAIYCERCGAQSRMPADMCGGCGNELSDVFRLQAPPATLG